MGNSTSPWSVLTSLALVIGFVCQSDQLQTQGRDDYGDRNGLQGSEYEVHLEDFFWTGSGDGPPSYARPQSNIPHTDSGRGGLGVGGSVTNTIIKTATVLATVYVDGSMESNSDPLCAFDCDNFELNSVETTTPTDRRYWLLTVISGFLWPGDFPIVQEKLAKLYRHAFTRQQARHLGLLNTSLVDQHSITRREAPWNLTIAPTKTLQYDRLATSILVNDAVFDRRRHRRRLPRDIININLSPEAIENATRSRQDFQHIFQLGKRRERRKVSVLIHNVTHYSATDIAAAIRRGDWDEKRRLNGSLGNQTEIIYSVFVSGKPVLATAAAKDMELLSHDEVVQVLESKVYTKAEPYLKEPQATPLIPSSFNGSSNLITLIGENPLWLVLICIVLLLFVSLLIGFLFMARAKRQRSAEIKRLTMIQSLTPHHHHHHHHLHDERDESSLKPDSAQSGHHNLAFVKDKDDKEPRGKEPMIYFPLPPATSRPTSSSSTSDSSVYFPKRRQSKGTLQEILDEKAAHLFSKKRRKQQEETADDGYAKVAAKGKDKSKQRRKYLSGEKNKVGSIEHAEVHAAKPSPTSSTASSDHGGGGDLKLHYNTNKLLEDELFHDDDSTPFVCRNPEHHLGASAAPSALHPERYVDNSDAGSIGSYLSMISIRSFPKSCVPEPLSRVLEPVSVTHLDHADADLLRASSSRPLEPGITDEEQDIISTTSQRAGEGGGGGKAMPAPLIYRLYKNSQEGGGGDAGELMSPIRDPIITRNRFEGLLEGAIRLYSGYDEEVVSPTSEMPGAIKIKDNRGKSAMPFRNPAILTRVGSGVGRPMTAGTSIGQGAESRPGSPSKAWSSGSHSPQVRPMSAGPFHRPVVDVTRVLAPQNVVDQATLSTAPLIEAIQNELKKFSKESNC